MKHISSKIVAYTIGLICLIFGIFALQFTKGKTFSSLIGSMTVSGRHEITKTGEREPLLPLHVVANGLDFYITDKDPLRAYTTKEEYINLKIDSYEIQEKAFIIHCSENISVTFFSETQGDIDIIQVKATMPETISDVLFPWKITQTARIERQDGHVFVQSGKQRFAFTGNFGLDDKDQEFYEEQSEKPFLVLSHTNSMAFYKTFIPAKGIVLETIALMPLAANEKYKQTTEAFAKTALDLFKKTINAKKYSESLLVAYNAEMGNRGMYRVAAETIPLANIPEKIKTYRSNPFYNNLEKTYEGYIANEKEQQELLAKQIKEGNLDYLDFPKLIPFLADRKNNRLIESLKKGVKDIDVLSLSVGQTVGILELYMDFYKHFPKEDNLFEDLTEVCERKLKESLLLIDEGLYISDTEKTIDTMDTLRCAHVLMRYGEEQIVIWKNVGQMLFTSLFSFAEDSASLPGGFTITGNRKVKLGLMVNDSKILDATELYPLVFPNLTWYPHDKSFALQAEKGLWAWTIAENIEVLENTQKILKFRIKFPAGETHYLVFRGIRTFYRIQMHDVDFRSEPRFEIYNSSGYVYNSNTNTLYVKMKHKNDFEEITLYLGRPAPPPAPIPVPIETPEIPEVPEEPEQDTETVLDDEDQNEEEEAEKPAPKPGRWSRRKSTE